LLTKDFAIAITNLHNQLLSSILDKDIGSKSDFTQQWLQLPIHLGGAGLSCLEARRFTEYMGGLWQGCRGFLDYTEEIKTDDGTVSLVTRKGFLPVQPIIDLFGSGSFNDNSISPWSALLSKKDSSALATSLDECWSGVQLMVQELTVDHEPSLFDKPSTAAGTGDDGKMLHPSVTGKLSQEFECIHRASVNLLHKTSQEKISWRETNSISHQFLLSKCDRIGFIPNRLFREIISSHFGMTSPNFQSGGYIGKTNPTPVDPYGNSVSACGDVSGPGFTYIHNNIRDIIADTCRTAGLHTQTEVTHHFREHLPAEIQVAYDSLPSEQKCIRADIRISNYPSTTEDVTTWGENSNRTMPALLEIKTIRHGTGGSRYSISDAQHERATDKRASQVVNEYRHDSYRIDKLVDPNSTRDEYKNPGQKGHFEQALDQHATGNVIPLVVGSFGDTSRSLEKLISALGLLAAKTSYGQRLSPHPIGSGKGAILKEQFQCCIGV
jgi:hypothetical protein